MKKKKYEKPSMEVYVINQPAQILAGSETGYGGFDSTTNPGFQDLP